MVVSLTLDAQCVDTRSDSTIITIGTNVGWNIPVHVSLMCANDA